MVSKKIELMVGLFVALGIAALLMLSLKVANTGIAGSGDTYILKAKFDNIGGLKVRSPIKVSGVVIGRVSEISLDKICFGNFQTGFNFFRPYIQLLIVIF